MNAHCEDEFFLAFASNDEKPLAIMKSEAPPFLKFDLVSPSHTFLQ